MKNPWMKFYPADWRADPALRSCTIAARGLWIEMLAIMHEAEPYGSLLIKGRRVDKKQLAGLANVPEKECTVLLLELEGMGVFERDDDGTIYSRRMRRDAAKKEKAIEDGKRGGNPTLKGLHKEKVKDQDKAQKLEARAKEDKIVEARANEFTDGSKALASVFWKALGFNGPLQIPPEYAGTDWRAIGWEKAGWTIDLIESQARKIGPGKPLSYYEKVFATEFAKRQTPLPVVEVKSPEKLTVIHGTAKNQSVSAVAKRLAEAFESQSGDGFAGDPDAFLRIPAG